MGTAAIYGLDEWWKLFTPRQLVALTTFSDLLPEVQRAGSRLTQSSGASPQAIAFAMAGTVPSAYADAIVTYLAFVVDKCADYWSTIC